MDEKRERDRWMRTERERVREWMDIERDRERVGE